jgi:hypothetical protein
MADYNRSATGPLPVDAGPRRAESIFDLSPEDFRASLGEMQALGHDTDALMRQYRARNSPFAPINNAAEAQAQDLADSGRRPVLGGLLSKPEGATGLDAIMGLEREGWRGLLGAGQQVGQAFDAPAAAAQGLIPQADVNMEALNTAGMAMGAGGAATAPSGALRSGFSRNVDDYAGTHRAPAREYGSSLDDPREMFGGDDIYTNKAANYFGHGDPSMDAESIRAINLARNNPDAELTVYRAVPSNIDGDVINQGDWVTTSRSYADGHGQGPLGGDYRVIEQKVRAGDLFTDGDIHEWGYAPNTTAANASQSGGLLGAGLSEAQRQARDILDMRASGNARSVTDDMMSRADDQYMFDNTPLPMDEASRLARADAGGFDTGTPLYHGARQPFDTFIPSEDGFTGPGVYTTPRAEDASDYAMHWGVQGQNVMPLHGKAEGFVDAKDFRDAISEAYNSPGYGEYPQARQATARRLADEGATGVDLINYGETADGYGPYVSQRSFFDPSNIRSRFARFDPEFSHLSNLSAANASPTAGLLASGAQEQDKPLPFMEMLRGLLR